MSRPANEERQAALKVGLRTYTGAPHSKCGTTEWYTAGGGCVHCARLLASEQREALRYQKAHEAQALDEKIEEQINSHEEFAPIDNLLPTELSPDTAAERLRHSIDELM